MLVFPDSNLYLLEEFVDTLRVRLPVCKYELLNIMGYRLMVGHQVLVLSIEVRVLVPQLPIFS